MTKTNNKGFFSLGMTFNLIVYSFALVGLWFVMKSISQQSLQPNLAIVIEDYKNLTAKVVTNPADQARVNEAFAQIESTLNKYLTSAEFQALKQKIQTGAGQ